MGLLAMIMMGDTLCGWMNIQPPEMLQQVQQSKFMYSMGVFFIGNQFQGALLSTGAFEIYIDEQLVFSKLESGDMPTRQQFQDIFSVLGIAPENIR